ncbi:MAG: response regulator, partial [Leeuwenhoekiella sp.]
LGLLYFLLYSYHRDVKRKNAQQFALLENEKEKEIYQAKIEFFTNVAHEIRTPLTLIKSPLEKLLHQSISRVEDIKDSLQTMDKNTSRLLNLVNELLDFRKTEINSLKLTFVETDIARIVENTIERFSPALEERKIKLNYKKEAEDCYAYADEEAVKKIISNLLHNATKFALQDINITVNTLNGNVIVIVESDGKRIPQELAHRIFEPFFRIDGNDNPQGTGLGLSLAHSLSQMHNGTLTLDNVIDGYNRFIFSLPIEQDLAFRLYQPHEDLHETHSEEYQDTEEKNMSTTKILIVEDDRDLLQFIAKELEEYYTILKASNGEEALKILNKNQVQLVISDVKMPVKNGFSLCKTVKNNLETSHIPVILLTAKKALSAKIEGLESGADAYLAKPFDMRHLKAQVASLIENRRHIMEYYSSTPLSHIKSIGHSETDEIFIEKLEEAIFANIANPDLNVDKLSDLLNMSRSTLYRKINDLSNLSPNELITITRLKCAAELLQTGSYKIYEVAEIVGFKSQSSFGRSFQKQFKMTPSQYINQKTPN